MNTTVDLNIQVRKHKFGVAHSSSQTAQFRIFSGGDSSVDAVLPQVVQLCAALVQVHVQHSSCRVQVEVRCDLVEGLAPSLGHPEECKDEEKQEESCEDQEDVRPA